MDNSILCKVGLKSSVLVGGS